MKPLETCKVLVTGAAGMIGSALIWALNQRGCEQIVACDILGTTEKWRNLMPLRFYDYLEAEDLFDCLEADTLGTFDLIFHLGACSATTEKDATYLIHNNFEFTKNLAEYALATGARFIYASSAATYGDGSAGMSDQAPDLAVFRPLNMYGYSKHLFDLHAWRHGYLDRIVGLKYFNVFGPNEHHKGDMRSVVHKAYQQIQETGRISLFKSYRPEYADGCQQRDFLYVKDAIEMTLHLATQKEDMPSTPVASGIYNIGSGEPHTWIELAEAIFAALDRPVQIEFIEMPEILRSKYQYFTQANIHKLRDTGYQKPVTPLKDAVADYVQHYLQSDKTLGA